LQVRQRPHIELKQLGVAFDVVKLQCREVTGVSASYALAPEQCDQFEFSLSASFLLSCIALMVVVRVLVLACPTTELAFSSAERRRANGADTVATCSNLSVHQREQL